MRRKRGAPFQGTCPASVKGREASEAAQGFPPPPAPPAHVWTSTVAAAPWRRNKHCLKFSKKGEQWRGWRGGEEGTISGRENPRARPVCAPFLTPRREGKAAGSPTVLGAQNKPSGGRPAALRREIPPTSGGRVSPSFPLRVYLCVLGGEGRERGYPARLFLLRVPA